MALSEPSKSFAVSVSVAPKHTIGLVPIQAGDVKKNGYMIISGFPCRVVDARFSKTGKHGSCKAALTGLDVLTKRKHTYVCPGDTMMHSFTLARANYQLVDIPAVDSKEGVVDVEYMDENYALQRISVPSEMARAMNKLLASDKGVNLQIIRAPTTNVSKASGDEVVTLEAVESFREHNLGE
jgi:hypothetical protein